MITSITDIHSVSVAISDAIAPVFLLTGIGSILGVLTNRLGRSIDRARELHEMQSEKRKRLKVELMIIVKRTKWLRRAIGLATLAALCVCVSIATLFISVETGFKMPHIVLLAFISSMLSIILALLCFLREIVLASREVIYPITHED